MSDFEVKPYREVKDLVLVEVATKKIAQDVIEKLNKILEEEKNSEN